MNAKKKIQLITTEKDYFRLNKNLQKECEFLKTEIKFKDKKKNLKILLKSLYENN